MTSLHAHPLSPTDELLLGALPDDLAAEGEAFDALWDLHPPEFHLVRGRIPTPRWQKAFAHDYRYSGSVNRADPLHPLLAPYLAWVQAEVDPRLNGLLVNWYDLSLRHYIGAHKDSPAGLALDAPIVTLSLGATRTFRLRRNGKRVDIEAHHGRVIVMPARINRRWDHQVPRAVGEGRRISITARAFEG